MPTISSLPIADGKPLKGFHVLLWMMGFFGLMFIVNGVFLWAALSSFPGEDSQHPYLQGLHYNETIRSRDYQDSMRWRGEIGIVTGVEGNVLVARILDAEGQPLPSRNVTGELRRAATQDSDMVLELLPTGAGEYRVGIPALAAGAWHVKINADIIDTGTDEAFTASKALVVK